MASMVIRNIPDDVLDRLQERARIEGKSMEQLAREALAERAGPSPKALAERTKPHREEIIRRMDEIRAMSKPTSGQAIIDEIRRDRDNNLGRNIAGFADGD